MTPTWPNPATATNLGELLTNTARRLGNRTALITSERTTTWTELDQRVDSAVAELRSSGVGPGSTMLVHAANSQRLFESMWTAFKLGAGWAPANPKLTAAELEHLASVVRPDVYLGNSTDQGHLDSVLRVHPDALFVDGVDGWDYLASTHPEPAIIAAGVDPSTPAWLFSTSGTTGRPKAAILTHTQLAYVVTSHLAEVFPGLDEHDTSLVISPLSHGAGVHALPQVARGATTVIADPARLDPESLWMLIGTHRVTNFFSVPTVINRLVASDHALESAVSPIKVINYGGAPMHRTDVAAAIDRLGPVLCQHYGLGEVTANITVLPPDRHHLITETNDPVGTCGHPRPGMAINIIDPGGTSLEAGNIGEVVTKGPAVFAGYLNNETATADAFLNGWFRTGDHGYLDSTGALHLTGRSGDTYISGGSNVHPREVEEHLLTHPDIADAAVVGVDDPDWGESGVAIIVTTAPAIDLADIRAHLAPVLAAYKHPKRIVIVNEIPTTTYGKVSTRLLTELANQ